MGISVIIPAYNEESNIARTMQLALVVLRAQFDDFEITLIDDFSTDRTSELADSLAAEHPEIRVIHNPKNMGQGASLLIGFQAARKEFVIHNAMDYPFDLLDLSKMTLMLDGADVVVAARKDRSAYSFYRYILSMTNVTLLNLLFGLRLHDYNFVQLYRREVLRAVNVRSHSTAFLTPEILIRTHDLGFRICEVSIEYHPRISGVATAGSPRVILHSIYDMFRFCMERYLA